MARENQGLQIALIIFVMLTIILGVTTFLYFRWYDEERTKAATASKNESEAKTDASAKGEDVKRLKKLMGFAETDDMQTVDTKFNEDMTTFAGTFPEDQRYYRPLVKQLFDTINARSAEVVAVKADVQNLKDRLAVREVSKDQQIQTLDATMKKQGDDYVAERGKLKQDQKRISDDQAKIAADLNKARKDAGEAIAKADAKLQEAGKRLGQVTGALEQTREKLEKVTTETVDVPDGEIRWVNQRTGVVWINVGRADGLSRQMGFSVYASDATDLTKTGKKGSIQVTQLLDEHLAEARIVEDQVSNPLMPGDKIFTPLWNAGEKKHFAVTGFCDLDGDGKSDINQLRDVIAMYGGIVDAWIDDKNQVQGAITVNTRYLVTGDPPNERGAAAMLDAHTKLITEAKRFGIPTLPLPELLQRMGWVNQTPVIRYGTGSNPNDFKAKAPEGVRTSTGNSIDFKPRNPPRANNGGAF